MALQQNLWASQGRSSLGEPVRSRCVTMPDEAQKVLLNRLGLTLPQRLRTIKEVEPMEWKTSAHERPWRYPKGRRCLIAA
jgi:hypothetical protein